MSKEELEHLKKLVDRADWTLKEAQICIEQMNTILSKMTKEKGKPKT